MCEYLNYHYVLKGEDKDNWFPEIEGNLTQIENSILKNNNNNETDLKLLKNK